MNICRYTVLSFTACSLAAAAASGAHVNDTCETALAVSGATPYGTARTVTFNDVGATANGPFASCGLANDPSQRDTWYLYTAAQTGTATIDGNVASSDATIAVFASVDDGIPGNCDAGPLLACSGPSPAFHWWSCLPVTAGSKYYIRVGRPGTSNTGNRQLRIREFATPTGGDSCSNPVTVSAGVTTWNNAGVCDVDPFENVGISCNQPVSLSTGAQGSLWFKFIPNQDGVAIFNTDGSNADTVMEAYSSCGGAVLACNNNLGAGTPNQESRLVVPVTNTVPIYVRLAQNTSTANTYYRSGTLDVSIINTLSNDACEGAQTVITGMTAYDNLNAADGASTSSSSCSAGGGLQDLWFSWTPDRNATAIIHTCAETLPAPINGITHLTVYQGCNGQEVA